MGQRKRSASAALDLGRRVQRAEHGDRFDRRPGEIGRDVVGDDRKAKHANFEPFACRLNGFEVLAGEGPQAQFKRQPRSRLLCRIGMGRELVADGGADEIRAIGIEAVAHQKIDRSEIDEAKVDASASRCRVAWRVASGAAILPSMWMLGGWYMDGLDPNFKGGP